MLGALDRLPVDEQSDRVFGLRDTIVRLAGGNASRGTGNDAGWDCDVLKDPAANIDVMGRKIVTSMVDWINHILHNHLTKSLPDIRIFACPCTEGLKLALRLTHPSIEEVELSKRCCAGFSITIDRVKSRNLEIRPEFPWEVG
jgi:hypothetical protein